MKFVPVALCARARGMLAAVCAVALAAGLAGCAALQGVLPGSNTTQVTVNLTTAQQQAASIDAALGAALQAAQSQMNATQQAQAATAKAALDVAVQQFQAMKSQQTALQLAKAVQDAIPVVVNAIPVIPPQYKMIVDVGVAVLDAFEAQLPAVSLPASVAKVG